MQESQRNALIYSLETLEPPFQVCIRDYNLMLPNLFNLSVDPLLCKLEERDESHHC